MPKPTVRLYMLAKDLASAMKAINLGKTDYLSGQRLAEDVKLPSIFREPILQTHPEASNYKVLIANVPRSRMAFEPESVNEGPIDYFNRIQDSGKATLFRNPDRLNIASHGLMSTPLFNDLANSNDIHITNRSPIEVPKSYNEYSNLKDMLPAGFRQKTGALDDLQLFKHSRDITDLIDQHKVAPDTMTSDEKVVAKAWEPHKGFIDYLNEVVPPFEQAVNQDPDSSKLSGLIASSIRNTADQMLPISEPRLRGVNDNLNYRRIFKSGGSGGKGNDNG